MNAIDIALLAVGAATDGNTAAAHAHISRAQQHVRTTARRDRQLVEIAALAVAGDHERAAGLALEHAARFPADADLVRRLTPPPFARPPGGVPCPSAEIGAGDPRAGDGFVNDY